ncbi:hypothetical protein B0H15DRAFT_950596 [Mycena belliarum]|uniref:Uncharacterized protein n=1 Tax=Mycena belliarum TaxID=1033014 RepID=A0AAD6XTD6_9AGAR|nr:hypothetical protein B0H15DRAFT_950596 [Mycena belliae]
MPRTTRSNRATARKKTSAIPGYHFSPQRAVFLKARVGDYLTALGNGRTPRFWTETFHAYWRHFPWRLPIDEDPHCAMLIDGVNVDLKSTEWEWRYQVVERTQMKIRSYFFRQRIENGVTTPTAQAAGNAAAGQNTVNPAVAGAEDAEAAEGTDAADAAEEMAVAHALLPAASGN